MNKTKTNNQILKSQDNVIKDIVNIINKANEYALLDLNSILVKRNWLIGRKTDCILSNSKIYGNKLLKQLSDRIKCFNSSFSSRRLYEYVKFYRNFKNIFRNSGKLRNSAKFNDSDVWQAKVQGSLLPWSYYVLLSSLNNHDEIEWYENETRKCGWNYLELKRNIKTDYYHRVLSNQLEHKTNELVSINPKDYLKSLYIFEFLGFKKNQKYKESQLEQALIDNLKDFMLELGKGYSYVGSQNI